jgi:hypothetical protein
MDIIHQISELIDCWCERRALRPLGYVLPLWPPPNGFTDEWQSLWAALRFLRAMCREDLTKHDESERVNRLIAELSQRLFPLETPASIEEIAEKLVTNMFSQSRD